MVFPVSSKNTLHNSALKALEKVKNAAHRFKAHLKNPLRQTNKIDRWLKTRSPATGTFIFIAHELYTKPFHIFMYWKMGLAWAPYHAVIHTVRWIPRIYLGHCLYHNIKRYKWMRRYRIIKVMGYKITRPIKSGIRRLKPYRAA